MEEGARRPRTGGQEIDGSEVAADYQQVIDTTEPTWLIRAPKASVMPNLVSFYEQKDISYFCDPGDHLARLINRSGMKVLDVGCGTRGAGNRLLRDGASWVTGTEVVPEKGEIARSVLNEVCIGDIEEMTFYWAAEYFDCFVFGDVLEHLVDPWGLLRRLRPFLADDGIVVASIPNVKHWPVINVLSKMRLLH